MALPKQGVPINFAQGLDLKTDSKQVQLGKFLALENTVYNKLGLLQKRNGYGNLSALPNSSSTYVTTFNNNLTAIGTSFNAYSQSSETWVNKGAIKSVEVSTLPLIRSNTNQSQADAAIAANGLICTVYTDNVPSNGTNVPIYKYAIANSVTGQNIIAPTVIVPTSGVVEGSPKVFLLGRNFIIVFTVNISSTYHLQYIAVSTAAPTAVIAAQDITSQYTPDTKVAFDGYVANNNLYLAWNGNDGGGAIRITYIDSTLQQHNTVVFTGREAEIMSVTADTSGSTAIVYVSFWDPNTTRIYTIILDYLLATVVTTIQVTGPASVANLTSTATAGINTLLYEINTFYAYDTSIATNQIRSRTITQSGSASASTIIARSVGLASKAFMIDDVIHFVAVYSSSSQPTYFVMNYSGKTIAKIAYSNGSGYYTTGIPSVTVTDDVAQFPYLIKDLVAAVNKTQGLADPAGIYSQTGINFSTVDFSTNYTTAEIGNNLNLSGGFLWGYDGYSPVEQGFHLWPDYVEATGGPAAGSLAAQTYFYIATYEWSDNQGNIFRSAPSIPFQLAITAAPVAFTGNRTSGSPIIAGVSTIVGLQIGQGISGTGIPAGTYILSIDSASQITLTANATSGSATGTTLTPTTAQAATVYVPTLRLTYKTANPVKIVLYRWSTAQQTYYQATSVLTPLLNDTSVDYVTFVDTQADSSILGNSILYTTGGVLENIAAPATSTMTLFQSRLFLVDAEDRNLLWFSKQVIEATPVEMSDLLTIYVAPTTSAHGSTGPISALSALDDKLIIFKKNAMYYINGAGPDNTGANSQFSEPTFITATVGSENQASIVFIPQGLMFQSDKGIWLLGRDLSTIYIGAPVENFTATAQVLSAVNVPGTNQVRFTLDDGNTLMYDYFVGQWGSFNNVPAISSTLYQDLHTYIDAHGNVRQETPGLYLDGSRPVLISLTTSWINLAGLQGFERAYFFYLLGTYISPHKLTVDIAYDYNPSPTQTSLITPTNYAGPYGSDSIFGGSEVYGGPSTVEQNRVFLQKQKCQAFQISITESFDPSYGTVAGAGLTLSGINLVVAAKSSWPRLKASKSVG